MAEWVQEQQKHKTRWVRAMSAETVQRDVEAPVAKANEDKRAAEVERDALRRDKERLTAKVKTLEREAAQRARATGGMAPGPAAEGKAEGPTAERGGGGLSAVEGRPTPPAVGSSWPEREHGMHRQRRRLDRCRPSPGACAWPCFTAKRRSGSRRWHPTWPRSLLPTTS